MEAIWWGSNVLSDLSLSQLNAHIILNVKTRLKRCSHQIRVMRHIRDVFRFLLVCIWKSSVILVGWRTIFEHISTMTLLILNSVVAHRSIHSCWYLSWINDSWVRSDRLDNPFLNVTSSTNTSLLRLIIFHSRHRANLIILRDTVTQYCPTFQCDSHALDRHEFTLSDERSVIVLATVKVLLHVVRDI